eukprot:m.218832 g.218832  ORF g.218832 m.218832 type:complete len:451 (+) comp10790_c1_seq6:1149-2501(+)
MPAFLPPPPLDLKRSSVPNVDYSFNSEYSCRRQSIESVESAQSDESWLGDDEVDPMLWQQPFPSQELIDEFVDQSYSIQQEACEESMIRDLFDFLDATHSGKIAIGMIRGHMQGFSPDSAFLDSEIMMLLAGTAVDEEGFIAYEEFSALVRRGLRGQCHPSGLEHYMQSMATLSIDNEQAPSTRDATMTLPSKKNSLARSATMASSSPSTMSLREKARRAASNIMAGPDHSQIAGELMLNTSPVQLPRTSFKRLNPRNLRRPSSPAMAPSVKSLRNSQLPSASSFPEVLASPSSSRSSNVDDLEFEVPVISAKDRISGDGESDDVFDDDYRTFGSDGIPLPPKNKASRIERTPSTVHPGSNRGRASAAIPTVAKLRVDSVASVMSNNDPNFDFPDDDDFDKLAFEFGMQPVMSECSEESSEDAWQRSCHARQRKLTRHLQRLFQVPSSAV